MSSEGRSANRPLIQGDSAAAEEAPAPAAALAETASAVPEADAGEDDVQPEEDDREVQVWDEEDDDDFTCKALTRRAKKHFEQELKRLYAYLDDVRDHTATTSGWRALFDKVKQNWKSGVVVALVNLPLSMSLAVAAKTNPVAGIQTCIWAGLFHAIFAGSSFNIVGPTGALSGLLGHYVLLYGPDVLPLLAVMAGMLCFLVFALKLERYVLLVPSSVLEGFTLGVAFIIGLNQINNACGLVGLTQHEFFLENLFESLSHLDRADPLAALMAFSTFGFLFFMGIKFGKIPWVILVAGAGSIIGYFSYEKQIHEFWTLKKKFEGQLDLNVFSLGALPHIEFDMLSASVSIAFVAILETFFSAKIADGMTNTTFAQRAEAFAIGICNVASGMFGGIPATAALARTALNIKSGATSRVSAVINAIVVFVMAMGLLRFFVYLPLPVVAGIVMNVAAKMVPYHHLAHIWHTDRQQFGLLLVVAFVCVIDDPTMGIVVGMLSALLIYADHISDGHSEVVMASRARDNEHKKRRAQVLTSRTQRVTTEKGLVKKKYNWNVTTGADVPQTGADDDEAARLAPGEAPSDVIVGHDIPLVEHVANVVIYRVAGPLSFINCFSHRTRILQFLNPSVDVLVISLRYNFFIDFDGANMLEELCNLCTKEKKRVFLSGIQQEVRHVLERFDFFAKKIEAGEVLPTYHDVYSFLDDRAGAELLEHAAQQHDLPRAYRDIRKLMARQEKLKRARELGISQPDFSASSSSASITLAGKKKSGHATFAEDDSQIDIRDADEEHKSPSNRGTNGQPPPRQPSPTRTKSQQQQAAAAKKKKKIPSRPANEIFELES